jgi:translation initiation factor IF-2
MERQLIKVAKELNVGMGTVVEFLTGKGFEIENRPISKVTDPMYDALSKKFSDSKADKEKADQIAFGVRPMQPTPQSRPTTPSVTTPPAERRTVTIGSISGKPTEEKPVVAAEKPALPDFIERPKIVLPKIVGKIDLTQKKEEPKPQPKADAKPAQPQLPRDGQQPRNDQPRRDGQQPRTDQPRRDGQQPRNDQPRRDGQQPRTDQPRRDGQQPRTDQPRRDGQQPRTDQPRRDGQPPRNDQPRRDGQPPRTDQPRRDGQQPRTDQPRRDGQQPRNDQPRRDGQQPRNDQRRDGQRNDRRDNQPIPIRPELLKAPVMEPVIIDPVDAEAELIRAEAPLLRGLNIKGKIDVNKFIEREKEERNLERNRRRERERDRRNGGPSMNAAGGAGQNTEGGNRNAGNAGESSESRRRRLRKPPLAANGTGGAGAAQQGGAGTGQQGGGNRTGGGGQGGGNRTGGGGQQGGNRTGGGQQGGNQQGGTGTGYQGGGNRTGGGTGYQGGGNRTGGGTGTGYQGGNNRAGGNNRVGGNTPAVPQSNEVTQAQIEAKIKETMARLNIGGKNKGQKVRRGKREKFREKEEMRQQAEDGGKLQVAEFISVSDLASLMDVGATDVIKTCMGMGYFVNLNQRLDAELIEVIAGEFGHEVEFVSAEEQVSVVEEEPDAPEDLVFRSPVVTIMGHVDHGKTSLLDNVRKADVATGEAGGITQHIGAYEVKLADGKKITFLDTPGHEAFTAMRARGAKVTDVAVVIISADDSIMPQTREAISHAQAAGVPMIFAINKIDKAGADPERIKGELAQMNLLVESWGGKFQSQDISAKKGDGVPELLEKILLEAELLDLKANPNKRASGTVIEASLDKGRGYVTKMLVQAGTLKIGDALVAGETAGKVKAMFNERGQKVLKAGPSTPVLVLGLSGAPQAGEIFKVMEKESDAKEIANKRSQIVREQSARSTKRISLDEIGRRLALGTFKELNLIIKGDVDGSVEALADSLLKQSQETVAVRVIHKAVGAITESDILLASASDAIIVGFQVRPSPNAKKLAEREGVEIKTYSIIYEAISEIRSAIEGMLEPTKEEKVTSTIEVREVFKITKVGTVAGCYVQEGKADRKNYLRVIRQGIVVFPVKENQLGTLASLKRFKDDVKEVKFGFECGLMIDNFNDIEVGDFVETYEIIEVKQKLAKQ